MYCFSWVSTVLVMCEPLERIGWSGPIDTYRSSTITITILSWCTPWIPHHATFKLNYGGMGSGCVGLKWDSKHTTEITECLTGSGRVWLGPDVVFFLIIYTTSMNKYDVITDWYWSSTIAAIQAIIYRCWCTWLDFQRIVGSF